MCLLAACAGQTETTIEPDQEQEADTAKADASIMELRRLDSLTTLRMSAAGLVDIREIDSRIQVDLRYAGANNFMGFQLYDTLQRAYLREDVALRLSAVQDYLDSLHPGYRLLVYDAVRPRQVQREMWNALDTIPVLNRGKFVSNPSLGSVHNFGAAVDITIVDAYGKELDMGAGYDDFRPIAFPSREAEFLKSGELSKKQVDNRRLLRRVMYTQRFSNIPSEWWHFNACSRMTASQKYQLLETESGGSRWQRQTVPEPAAGDSLIE